MSSEDMIRCPHCGHVDEIYGFDAFGSCDGQVFCPLCHCEFDSVTMIIHYCTRDCRRCEFCDGKGCPMCPVRKRTHQPLLFNKEKETK